MVSLAYLFVALSVFAAAVFADDVKSSQTESQDEKWLGGWGGRWSGWYGSGIYSYGWGCTYPWINRWGPIAGYSYFPYYPNLWFKKATNSASTTRRSVITDAEQLVRRDESIVACKNTQGQTDHFVLSDCHQAVQALVSKKASSANCKSCAVKLVSPNGQLAATGAPADALQKVADKILKSCAAGANGASSNYARRSPADNNNSGGNSKEQFAMIIQKGDSAGCDA